MTYCRSIYNSLQIKQVIKKSQSVELKVFSMFCLLMEGSGSGAVHIITDPDPGGPKTSEPCYEYYFKAFLSYLARNMRFLMYCLSSPTLCPVTFTISASFAMENRQFSALNGTRRTIRALTLTKGLFGVLNSAKE